MAAPPEIEGPVNPPDLLRLVAEAESLRPNTRRAYTNAVRQWLAFAGNSPQNWTAPVAQAFYKSLLAPTKDAKGAVIDGLTTATANNMLRGGVSFVLTRANALGCEGVRDVTKAVDYRKVHDDADAPSKRHSLTAPQARALLSTCEGNRLIDLRDHAMVILTLYTGMRNMSLVAVDLAAVKEFDSYVTLHVPIKGGATYNVPVDKRAWTLTAAYRKALGKARGVTPNEQPMFPSIGQPYPTAKNVVGDVAIGQGRITTDGWYRAVTKRAETAKLPHFHPHLFRHTFSTWCRTAGVEDYLIEVITGHKGARGMVDRVYADKDAMKATTAARCYEAVTAKIRGGK